VAATPDAANTLGGTEVDETPAVAVPGVAGAPPGPAAETVGADGGAFRGMSEPNWARLCAGGAAIMGPGVDGAAALGACDGPADVTGLDVAAGGGADAGADAGAASVTAGGGVGATCGVVGTGGAPPLAARPLVNPCERSWAADAGVGRPDGVVAAGMLGVLGIDGIGGGRIGEADMLDPAELTGGMIAGLPPEPEAVGVPGGATTGSRS
jgi:hypothetical protein